MTQVATHLRTSEKPSFWPMYAKFWQIGLIFVYLVFPCRMKLGFCASPTNVTTWVRLHILVFTHLGLQLADSSGNYHLPLHVTHRLKLDFRRNGRYLLQTGQDAPTTRAEIISSANLPIIRHPDRNGGSMHRRQGILSRRAGTFRCSVAQDLKKCRSC